MALFELRCPSLDYVYDMSYHEFLLRLMAFERSDKRSWYKVREVAYSSLIGAHYDPKKLPKTIEAYLPLREKTKVSEDEANRQREIIKSVQEQYFKDLENAKK